MKARLSRWIRIGGGLLLLAVLALLLAPYGLDRLSNTAIEHGPGRVTEAARALHERLEVVDLHADSLLWQRDLLDRHGYGHVDVPRLIEGNVAVQALTVVTKIPWGMNYSSNDADSDSITLLAIASGWPVATWGSLLERARHQARRAVDAAARSGGTLVLLRGRADLETYLARRRHEPRITAGFLGVEGSHCLEGRLENVDVLFDEGFRMMAPSHFFDNELGGSASGLAKGGLTTLGREFVKRLEEKGIVLDLAHASPALIDDVLAVATRPVVVSHTGVRGVCDNPRNISDDHVRGIAATGGVIGIGFWRTATCGDDIDSIVDSILHVKNLVGIDHVALGSDFDGTIAAPLDASGMARLTEGLLARGLGEDEVRKVMGASTLRVLGSVWK